MIKKVEITGVHESTEEKLKKYVTKSVDKLERFMPKHARESARAEVRLIESKKPKGDQCMAEIILILPQETLTAKESTVNMFAAVDIVEAKLRNQLKRYKETHGDPKFYRRLTSRFKRRYPNQI